MGRALRLGLAGPRIPKGFCNKAQGCEERATLGNIASRPTNPNGVASVRAERRHNPVGVERWFARSPRVARRLATLGWRTRSLRDWPGLHSGIVSTDKGCLARREATLGPPRRDAANPEGILQQSPGLRGTSYPG